jgi:hypothetical protein
MKNQGLTFDKQDYAAPAKAGVHYVCQSRMIGEIGSRLRWSDVAFCFEVDV